MQFAVYFKLCLRFKGFERSSIRKYYIIGNYVFLREVKINNVLQIISNH